LCGVVACLCLRVQKYGKKSLYQVKKSEIFQIVLATRSPNAHRNT